MVPEERNGIFNNYSMLEDLMSKYNPVLSSRDHRLEYLIDNKESEPFPYTEEHHSYDRDKM